MIKIKMGGNDGLFLFGNENKIKKLLGKLYNPRCFYQKNSYWSQYKKSYYIYHIGSYQELLDIILSGEKTRFLTKEEDNKIVIRDLEYYKTKILKKEGKIK